MTTFGARSIDVSAGSAIGLSVGSTTLAAVTAERWLTARPVTGRAGHLLDGFVDRVGDPVGIVAPDGTLHAAADLLAEALGELVRTVTAGGPPPETIAVAHPGHWRPATVEALAAAMSRVLPLRADLIPDYVAAVTALRADLPDRGVAAVCDLGGSATTVTLVDLESTRAVGTALRLQEFAGDAIDRAVLTHVLAAGGVTPGSTGTSAISSLTRLRAECRAAKERLSRHTATQIPGRAAGLPADIRLTRPELDELIRGPLKALPAAARELLQRNGIPQADLVAVVSVGGGAAIPAVTAVLSQHLRVPVVTAPHPALAPAVGAALAVGGRGRRGGGFAAEPQPAPAPVAWSQATVMPEFVAAEPSSRWSGSRWSVGRGGSTPADLRPSLSFSAEPASAGDDVLPLHRRPIVIAAAVLLVVAGAGAATALALHTGPAAAPAPATAETPAVAAPPPADGPPRTVVALPAPGATAPAEISRLAPVTQAAAAEPERPVAPAPAPDAVLQIALPELPAIPPIPPIPAIPQIPGLPQLFPPPAA